VSDDGTLDRTGRLLRTPEGDIEWFTVIGGVGILLFLCIGIFGPTFAPYPNERLVGEPFSPPSADHLLGTDDAGRDIFSLLLIGTRVSLFVGLVAGTAAILLGTLVGVTAGVVGGRVESALMRVVDIVLTIPFLPLIIVVAALMGPGLWTTIGVLAAVMWARPARELRAEVLKVRREDFVEAATAMGASARHVAVRYVVPAVLLIVIAQYARAVSMSILLEAALSFLGLGDPTQPSWGSILFWAQQRSAFLTGAWVWWVIPPGLAITVSVLSFIFVTLGVERHSGATRRSIATDVPSADFEILSRSQATSVADGAGVGADSGGRDGDASTTLGHEPAPDRDSDSDRTPVLEVDDLTVAYGNPGTVAVDGVSIALQSGETLGVVGESGSGKSSVALAVLDLLREPGRVIEGRVRLYTDRDSGESGGIAAIRGDEIGFVPQEAMNALDPRIRIVDQVIEAVEVHCDCDRSTAAERAHEQLAAVGLPKESHDRYPFEVSGGMRQRAVVATALVNDPSVLIVDEPTTGLDVVTTVNTLELLEEAGARRNLSTIVVSHDLAAVTSIADRIAVMSEGRILEVGTTDRLQTDPDHPYTEELLACQTPVQSADSAPDPTPTDADPSLVYDGVSKRFGDEQVLDDASFTIDRGQSVALLGESGAGKSTLGQMAVDLVSPDEGVVRVDGRPVAEWSRRTLGQAVHYVFQDPYSSLAPNRPVEEVVTEPLDIHDVGSRDERVRRAHDALAAVDLTPADSYAGRYPAELSGGERQRVAFARALVSEPSLLIADEPTSMLDAPLQRELLDLLYDLVADRDITLLHITHDIAQAVTYAEELAVLHEGAIVEQGAVASVFQSPEHEQTRTLLSAATELSGADVDRLLVDGDGN